MLSFYRILASCVVLSVLAGSARGAESLPGSDEVRQLYTDGKFTEVVRVVTKIVKSHEWQAKKPDGYELYTLKAEAHLRLKQMELAASTFELAAKMAMDDAAGEAAMLAKTPGDETLTRRWNDARVQAAVARSTGYLIKHSIGMHFFPKPTAEDRAIGAKPEDRIKFDIVDPETRKQALTALWNDAKNASAAAFAAASNEQNTSADTIMKVAPAIGPLRELDMAANGNDAETRKVAALLADRCRDIFKEPIEKMAKRLDDIAADAVWAEKSYLGQPNGKYVERWRKRGLDGKQPAELQDMLTKSTKIAATLKILSEGLGTEKDSIEKSLNDATHIRDMSEKILKTKYSETFATKEEAMKW